MRRAPAAVTIARSVADGFTPDAGGESEWLLQLVVRAVEELLPERACRLQTHDLTADLLGRCSRLFLHPKAAALVRDGDSDDTS